MLLDYVKYLFFQDLDNFQELKKLKNCDVTLKCQDGKRLRLSEKFILGDLGYLGISRKYKINEFKYFAILTKIHIE